MDGDGDLDVWLAQYKPPYVSGQMPTPYYDANDGYPAYLLLNDGAGGFSPATEAAGLAEKRFRRTYASSFVDLDGDDDLDLLVVSDFAGVDLYHNDGSGHFVDANETLRANRHLFGMSAAFGDYDLDGRLDFFVAGMASTTAQRLEALGLGRGDRPEMQEMRMSMAFGNRMFLAEDGGWREPEFRDEVAHGRVGPGVRPPSISTTTATPISSPPTATRAAAAPRTTASSSGVTTSTTGSQSRTRSWASSSESA